MSLCILHILGTVLTHYDTNDNIIKRYNANVTETPNCYTMYNDINVTVPTIYHGKRDS